VWWARRELRIAQEACCDALVISRSVASRRKYAETLFQALEFLQAERSTLPAVASGFGNKSSTERRFEMIASPLVNHRLSWWSYPVALAALAVLPCLPGFTQAQDQAGRSQEVVVDYGLVPVEINDLDGDPLDANRFRVEIKDLDGNPLDAKDSRVKVVHPSSPWSALEATDPFWRQIVVKYPGQTNRRVYKPQRSKLGVVVLAFELESGKLAWSSEIELPADGKAVTGQRFLLHTGGGVVTIAVVQKDQRLEIQELDAETGRVVAQTRLPKAAQDRFGVKPRKASDKFVEDLHKRLEELTQRQRELLQQATSDEQHRKQMEADAQTASEKLLKLLDEQLRRVADDGLRAPQRDWVLRQAKQLGDALVIDTGTIGGRPLTVETAGTVWRLINGNAPIQSVRIVREDGKDRMIIEGKANKHRRIILDFRIDDDKPPASKKGEPGTRTDGRITEPGAGASTESGATDALVRKAAEYFSGQRRGTPVDGFDYAPENEPRIAPPPATRGANSNITEEHVRHAWLDLYGLPLTD
jgi:hypothetical protein